MRTVLIAALLVASAGCAPQEGKPGVSESFVRNHGELEPDQLPYRDARLILSGTELPVEMSKTREGDVVVFHLLAHGEELETERYESDSAGFRFVGGSGETFKPAIPLVRYPLRVGETWEWAGQTALGPTEKPAKATITTQSERLNLASGVHNAIRVGVALRIETGRHEAKRDLTFWIAPKAGVVRREFGAGSAREPRNEVIE